MFMEKKKILKKIFYCKKENSNLLQDLRVHPIQPNKS